MNNEQEKESATSASSDEFSVSAPKVELPKGGGAIKGIGEKFAANPVTGTGSMSVPIATSPGRAGFGPQLSLSYDSGAGNGIFGFGWSLSMPSITRKTDKGLPRYFDTEDADQSDVFILSGAEDLVPLLNMDGTRYENITDPIYTIHRYRPRIEGLFARIERWTNKIDGDVHWRSISKDNILTIYGKDSQSRISDPEDPGRIFSWLICETRDDKGNAVVYQYKPEDGVGVTINQAHERNRGNPDDQRRSANRYLKRILYGNVTTALNNGQRPRFLDDIATPNHDPKWMFEIVFDYGEHDDAAPKPDDLGPWVFRADPFSTYRPGFEVRTTRLCQRVLMFHHFPDDGSLIGESYDGLVRSTDFTYSHQQAPQDSRNPIYTFLQQVTQTGYKRKNGQAANDYNKRSLPPVEFTYSQPIVQDTVEEVESSSLENLPIGVDGAAYQWTDLHSEGIPGILSEQADSWWYKRNISPISGSERRVEFTPLEQVASRPNMALASGAQFMDLAGDGQLDLVMLDDPTPGFVEHDKQEGWQSFKPFQSRLNRNFQDPNLRFIDLVGDGHADVIVSEDDAFIWHASLAESGFGPTRRVTKALDEENGPRLVFADGTQSIFLADMSGDGLTDLVRIRNGEICYWPNQGYCRFGAKISMDNAPHFDYPDQFEHIRLRVADIDGTGAADLIYLHGDGVRLYFNQSGNSWSEAQVLGIFPRVDEIVSIAPADLLGNGTACLVWSSPLPGDSQHRMRYVNLMGEQKPHLLIKTKNNLGAETEMFYAPSTRFYLQDKRDGKPWVTKLPFPVHVVEKVVVTDKWRKTRFATTYSYHHGCFDGVEREFRGFGRVEQVDVETYGEFIAGNASSPYITDDKTLYQPPIKTISWFHTGAPLDRERILSQYRQEYFKLAGFTENELPEPDLDSQQLNSNEWREAMRACKGLPLRQEVYELDVDALEQGEHRKVRLFSTAFHNCNIQMLQAQAANRHAVFLVTESEAISYQYDLDLRQETPIPDPRIAHTLNLNIDQFGNVLQSVGIVYPRIGTHSDDSLGDTNGLIERVQKKRYLAYTETRFTDDVDDSADFINYRLRQPCEVLSYELTGISPGASHFILEEFQELNLSPDEYPIVGTKVAPLQYHEIPDPTLRQKRIVEHVRMLFFKDDSGDPEFLKQPLHFGELGHLGLPFETYKLALTDSLLDAIFDTNRLTDQIRAEVADADKSGYLSGGDLAVRFENEVTAEQYWIRSGIAGFADDAAEHFFLPEEYTDPFGNTSTLVFDQRDLFIASSTDPLGNHVSVEIYDYRVLAPRETKDINDNLAEVIFDTLGLPTATAVKGKSNQADNLLGFTDDLLDPDLDTRKAFFGPVFEPVEARRLLDDASGRHIYDFGEQREADGRLTYGHRPASAAAVLREHHAAQAVAGESPLQVAFEYSDGGGNVLAQISQAEAGPVPARDVNGDIVISAEGQPQMTLNDVSPRWICSGLIVLNNKGNPVKQYEPYFTDLHGFEYPVAVGVTPVMYYDAADRPIRTEMPDGSYSRVEFSPWHVISFDQNDTVLEPGNKWFARHSAPSASTEQKRAASLAAEHENTPGTVFLDSLGRDVISVEHNRIKDAAGDLQDEKYVTFTMLDTEGKPLWIQDARGNLVMQYIFPPKVDNDSDDTIPANSVPCYDIAGNLLFQHSMDGGDRWMISDSTGQPFYAWDENENENGVLEQRRYHTLYDSLRRPLEQMFQINDEPVQVIDRLVYGEDQAGDKTKNLRGQLFQHYDSSGVVTNENFDFKGNQLEVKRQLTAFTEDSLTDWTDINAVALDETYTQTAQYDALNRMTHQENWHIQGRDPAINKPQYNKRGLLLSEALTVKGEVKDAIVKIEYDAKGQRQFIEYGNGTVTRYDYDTETFRLKQLHTTKTNTGTPLSTPPSNLTNTNALQNLYYTYDPIGNITEIHDDAYEPVFFKNQQVEPRSLYRYDSLYRLIQASGRENFNALPNAPKAGKLVEVMEKQFPIADQALRNYTQHYSYDSVGNIKKMEHKAGTGSWTRHYRYAPDSNRLVKTWQGSNEIDAIVYLYDTHGSMLNLNNTADEFKLLYDSNDMIHHINLGGGGDAFYRYGSDKERSCKRIVRINGDMEERIYLGGMERYRCWKNNNPDPVEEIETYHVFDGEQRVLMVERVIKGSAAGLPTSAVLFKYQYTNHLGSVGLEVDEDGNIISYEEYHPYGTTAFSARGEGIKSTKKRYRYTGMERDEESGLSYHSARYYLPWLGRWGSVDPAGLVDGGNLYRYSRNNPITMLDETGSQSKIATRDNPYLVDTDSIEKLPLDEKTRKGALMGKRFWVIKGEHKYYFRLSKLGRNVENYNGGDDEGRIEPSPKSEEDTSLDIATDIVGMIEDPASLAKKKQGEGDGVPGGSEDGSVGGAIAKGLFIIGSIVTAIFGGKLAKKFAKGLLRGAKKVDDILFSLKNNAKKGFDEGIEKLKSFWNKGRRKGPNIKGADSSFSGNLTKADELEIVKEIEERVQRHIDDATDRSRIKVPRQVHRPDLDIVVPDLKTTPYSDIAPTPLIKPAIPPKGLTGPITPPPRLPGALPYWLETKNIK